MVDKLVHVLKVKDFMPLLRKMLPSTKLVFLENINQGLNDPTIEVVLGTPTDVGPLLFACPNLRWCQITFAGADSVVRHCREEGKLPKATVTRFGGVLSHHMAEWTIARMVSYERRFLEVARNQDKSFWDQENYMDYRPLYDLTIGIIGFGDIGLTIAKRCKAFGMTVLSVGRSSRTVDQLPDFVDDYRQVSHLAEVLSRADYICSVVPDTKETDGLFDNGVLKVCSEKRPVFMNIGRGSVVSEASLLEALESGWLRHAILDVYEEEPLPRTSELWRHPHVTVSPHVSGCSLSTEVSRVFAENYRRFLAGEQLKFVVDLEKGY